MQREATAMNVRQNLGELLKPTVALENSASVERMLSREDGEFARLWTEVARGFDDLSEDEVGELVDTELKAVRAQIYAGLGTEGR
ncbi:MAG: hypothetical protein H7346_12430 [Burkholderiaceae bacterium]|nr:hypothetical protein [Burkholderiaceae bacterium]